MALFHNKVFAIIVALPAEARPFIRKFGLQKVNGSKPASYRSESVWLIISGVGRKNAALAGASLLEYGEPLALCNVGICGSRDKRWEIGSTIYVNKIRNSLTGETYYPDPLARHNFPEAGLVTHDEPQGRSSINRWPDLPLVDMEASYICKEIQSFIPPHRWHFLKVVSDYLQDEKLTANGVERLMKEPCEEISFFIENLCHVIESEAQFTEMSAGKLERFSAMLHLTITQKRHLKRLCLHRISTGDKNLKILDLFTSLECTEKAQRNKIFEQICDAVLQ
ncbi:MAG: hypothetical protein CMI32_07365 [Opitutales bacterium]|nr:hypothetical protein [Opitutales bacterium]|tara:strand:+ start:2642 stop:3481 length:840 start_codon:yes stop_codon:yes gene_type:complete